MMPWSILGAFMAKNNPLQYADAWVDPKNARYDISYYDWLKQNNWNDASIDLAYNTNPTHGMSAYDASALMMMFAGAFASVQQQIARSSGGAMGYTAKGGNQSIPEAMANALKHEVQLNTTVTGIRSEGGQAEVHWRRWQYLSSQTGYLLCALLGTAPHQDRSDSFRAAGARCQHAGVGNR